MTQVTKSYTDDNPLSLEDLRTTHYSAGVQDHLPVVTILRRQRRWGRHMLARQNGQCNAACDDPLSPEVLLLTDILYFSTNNLIVQGDGDLPLPVSKGAGATG